MYVSLILKIDPLTLARGTYGVGKDEEEDEEEEDAEEEDAEGEEDVAAAGVTKAAAPFSAALGILCFFLLVIALGVACSLTCEGTAVFFLRRSMAYVLVYSLMRRRS
jgi:hypothetical protein